MNMPNSFGKNLNDLKKLFFEKPLQFEPVSASFWGLREYDPQLRIEDDQLREEERKFYAELIANLEEFRNKSLPSNDRIDVEIMYKSALWNLRELEKPHPMDWRTSADISDLVDVVHSILMREPKDQESWEAILTRMQKIPSVILQRQKNLTIGFTGKFPFYRREVLDEGIELIDEVSGYFEKDVQSFLVRLLPKEKAKQFKNEIEKAAIEIRKALQEYSSYLRATVLPLSTDDSYAIGEEEYVWRLKNLLFIDETPESLLNYGKKKVEETHQEMQKLAKEIWYNQSKGSNDYSKLLAELQKQAPKSDSEMVEMYRNTVKSCVEFVQKHRLFQLPGNYDIRILETPAAYRNVLSVAAMIPIPPFLDGVPAQFWVTPTGNAKQPLGKPELLQLNHSKWAAKNLVVHEAVPGHDLQLGASARQFIQDGRKDLSYLVRQKTPDVMFSLGVEGWAHYAEHLMAEQGFLTPEEKLFQLKDTQWRNVRIVVDIGIHTRKMAFNEAVDYFNEKTLAGKVTSEREIYRYSKFPLQAITYHLGKRDILTLKDEARKVTEKTFSLSQFHELLLSYHGIPVSLFRQDFISRLQNEKQRKGGF